MTPNLWQDPSSKTAPMLVKMLVIFGLNSPAGEKRPGDVCGHLVTKNPDDPVTNDKGETIRMTGDQLLRPPPGGKQGAVRLAPAEVLGAQGGKVYLTRHQMACHGYSEQEIEQAYGALASLAKRDETKAPLLETLHKLELGEYLRHNATAEIKARTYPKAHVEAAIKQAIANAQPGEGLAAEVDRLKGIGAAVFAAK